MTTIFKEPDYNTIQMLYGFLLVVLAVLATTILMGNVVLLTAIVAMILLKDGIPNLVMGALAIGKKPEKKLEGKV